LEGLDPISPDTLRVGLGGSITGTLGATAETDLVVFDGTMGDEVFLSVLSTTMANVEGRLYAPSGTEVQDINRERAELTLPETGQYTLRVRSGNLLSTGSYVVRMDGVPPLFAAGDTVRLGLGSLQTGTLAGIGEMDFLIFDGTTGDEILLAIQEVSGFQGSFNYAPSALLYGPSGQMVIGSFQANQVQATLPATGTYAVRVDVNALTDASGSNGTYTIGLEGLDPLSQDAVALTVGGGATAASLGAIAETDIYTFSGTAGGSVSVTLGTFGTATVYAPSLSAMVTFGAGTQAISLPATGTYIIAVRSGTLLNTGNYTISVQ
jgi:hypothetical protein